MRLLGRTGRARLCVGAAAAVLAFTANVAQAQSREPIDIAAQPLESALYEFGGQTGLQVLFAPGLAASKRTAGVEGETDVQLAMARLLQGTGLTYRRDGDMFVIVQQGEGGNPQADRGAGGAATVEALIVTAQKREEDIQDVPIAISAFSAKTLDEMKIEGGFDLLKAIPNVTFSKTNFTSYNFSIRGIGTKAVSATTDPGVAVAFNNSTIIQNRLFEQEYYDVERVEVLRGPQGTLYGRNATSGVINVISAKPDLNDFEGFIKGEVGNYHTKRLSAMVNVPLVEDVLAVRLAGALTDRQGYDFNSATGNAVNGRDLWSARLTVGFEPNERLRGNFIWERFREDDDRSRTGKQLCHHDAGPDEIGGIDTDTYGTTGPGTPANVRRARFSQGCLPGSLYVDEAFGTPNGLAYNFILGAVSLRTGQVRTSVGIDENGEAQTIFQARDPYGNRMQSRDLRVIESFRDPVYRAAADLFELNLDFDITDSLTFISQTAYVEDETYSFQDFNRFNSDPVFTDTSRITHDNRGDWTDLAPGGIFCDPQLGCSNTIAGFDIAQAKGTQFNQEFRLQSSFDGPVNFNVGANYTKFDTLVDYYVMFNAITAMASIWPFWMSGGLQGEPFEMGQCTISLYFNDMPSDPVPTTDPDSYCPHIDPNPVNPSQNFEGDGHNYFRSKNPYKLESWAAFGEAYWNIREDLKLTAGLRYTDDTKTFIPVPTQTLLAPSFISGGVVPVGYPEDPPLEMQWGEFTGRLVLDWKPELAFTDETLLYGSYSRGYKGGGANPPLPDFATEEESHEIMLRQGYPQSLIDAFAAFIPGVFPILELTANEYGRTFEPEFVNAFEIGAKNTLLDGAMTFNATAFYYDYTDYQVSQIRDRTAVNENFDAKIWGLEFETMFAPSRDLRIIANLGYLDTEIADGETSIDIMNRTQGNPDYVMIKPWVQLPSNCIVPVDVVVDYFTVPAGIGGNQIVGTSQAVLSKLCGRVGGLARIFFADPLDGEVPPDPLTGRAYDPTYYDGVNPGTVNINGGAGILADLGGNELPNAPHWTANIGAQYGWNFLSDWRATVRGDVYWQSQSYHRIYNAEPYDKLRGWYNANLSVWIERPDDGLKIELYAKNILDDTPITDAFLNSDDTGLTTNVFVLDPRLIGLSIRKEF